MYSHRGRSLSEQARTCRAAAVRATASRLACIEDRTEGGHAHEPLPPSSPGGWWSQEPRSRWARSRCMTVSTSASTRTRATRWVQNCCSMTTPMPPSPRASSHWTCAGTGPGSIGMCSCRACALGRSTPGACVARSTRRTATASTATRCCWTLTAARWCRRPTTGAAQPTAPGATMPSRSRAWSPTITPTIGRATSL